MFTPTLPEKVTAPVLREQLHAAAEYMGGLQKVDAEKRDASWAADIKSAIDFIHQADPQLTALERGNLPTEDGPTGNTRHANPDRRSLGEQFVTSDDYANAGSPGWGATRSMEIEMRGSMFNSNHEFRADITTGVPGGGAFLPQAPNPIPPTTRQMRLFLRDVLSVSETGLATVPYIREVTPAALEYGASAVAEGTTKPEVQMDWDLDEAQVRKIAAWVPVTSEAIDDAPTLRGFIDQRLSYMLAVREEFEILSGSGAAPHLKGLYQYAGEGLQTYSNADKMVALGYSIGLVENKDGEADGIAMNPLDYWSMITTRQATQFDGAGTAAVGNNGAPFVPSPQAVWGLPVIRSRAIAAGKALVGSWGLGATLFDRMQTTIRVGNQHSDFFVTNKIAVLAEERVALAVHRPDFFVDVTFA